MVLFILAIGGIISLASVLRPKETFSEFYILGPEGKLENYPSELKPGEAFQLTFGIANHEGRSQRYRIMTSNQAGSTVILETEVADGETFEQTLTLEAPQSSGRTKLPFDLYIDDLTEPYRSLHLFIDLKP
jgi:uncharacterized membrane protein